MLSLPVRNDSRGLGEFGADLTSGGLILGIITTAFCGTTAFTGLYLLSRSAGKTTQRGASFSSLAAVTFPSLSRLFDLAIFLKCFGVSVSYLIVVGSLMPRAVVALHADPPEWTLERKLWIMLAMTVLTPLAFYRRLDSLKMISYIALVAVADLVSLSSFSSLFRFLASCAVLLIQLAGNRFSWWCSNPLNRVGYRNEDR